MLNTNITLRISKEKAEKVLKEAINLYDKEEEKEKSFKIAKILIKNKYPEMFIEYAREVLDFEDKKINGKENKFRTKIKDTNNLIVKNLYIKARKLLKQNKIQEALEIARVLDEDERIVGGMIIAKYEEDPEKRYQSLKNLATIEIKDKYLEVAPECYSEQRAKEILLTKEEIENPQLGIRTIRIIIDAKIEYAKELKLRKEKLKAIELLSEITETFYRVPYRKSINMNLAKIKNKRRETHQKNNENSETENQEDINTEKDDNISM